MSRNPLLAGFALALIIALAGCGGGGGSGNGSDTGTVLSVTISPTSASGLAPGDSQTFAATVLATGTASTDVTWSVSTGGGAVFPTSASTATYVAPEAIGTFYVVATSVADPTKSATATISTGPPGPPPPPN